MSDTEAVPTVHHEEANPTPVQAAPAAAGKRRWLRGILLAPLGILPALFWTWLLGPVVGAVLLPLFVFGSYWEFSKPVAVTAGASINSVGDTGTASVTPAPVRKRRWWVIPTLAIAGLLAVVVIDANFFPPDRPKKPDRVDGAKFVEKPKAQEAAPQAAAAAPAAAEGQGKDTGKYVTFNQRPCNGIEDCTAANIEAEQTEASRTFNRIARTSMASAIKGLGPPTYVLRKGEVVDVPGYDGIATEGGFAEAVVGWANGKCRPNELVIRKEADRILTSPDTGGTTCTRSGSPYPLPPQQFACAGGRKSDPFCSIEGILKLPGMEERQPHPYEGDPAFNSGRHLGYLTWATDNCHGRMTGMFKAAMNLSRGASKVRFDAGVREGIAEMKRSVATSGIETACLTIRFLYGGNGQNIPNAWQQ